MARQLDSTTFAGLHKAKHNMDTCFLTGTGIDVGDKITVVGSKGSTKTRWEGVVMAKAGPKTFTSSDLHVVQEQVGSVGPVKGEDTENVSITVTNPDDTTDYDTITVPNAPIIP